MKKSFETIDIMDDYEENYNNLWNDDDENFYYDENEKNFYGLDIEYFDDYDE